MQAPIENFTTGAAAQAYLLLNVMESVIEERKKALRDRLLADAEEKGTTTDNGSQTLDADGNSVTREKREKHTLKEKKVAALLEKHGLNMEDGFDKVVTWVPSPTKLKHLVEVGAIPVEELEGLTDVVWAIRVTPSEVFGKLLDEAKKNLTPKQLEAGTKKK